MEAANECIQMKKENESVQKMDFEDASLSKQEDKTVSMNNTENVIRCTNTIIISDDEDSSISDNDSMDLETRSVISGCTSIGDALKNMNLDYDTNMATREGNTNFTNTVRIGIIPEDSSQKRMRYPQIKQIQEAVLDCAEEQLESETRVQFLGCQCGIGYLIMICASQETADWLKLNIHKVAAKCAFALKAVDEANFPKPVIVHGYFHQSADYTNEKILKRIEISNKNLVTKKWNVVKRTQNGNTLHLLILIDDTSAATIKKGNGYIFYRFGQIKLKFENPERKKNVKKFKNVQRRTLTMGHYRQSISYNSSFNVTSKNVSKWLVCTENYNTENIKRKKSMHVAKLPNKLFISPWQQ